MECPELLICFMLVRLWLQMPLAATSDRCTRTVEYRRQPRAILSYQQTDDVLFYASYSKGYQVVALMVTLQDTFLT